MAHGLDRIFSIPLTDQSSLASSQSDISCDGDDDNGFDLTDCIRKSLPRKPCRLDVIIVDDLESSSSVERILSAEGRRSNSHWLVVYVRGSTTALLFPPRKSQCLSQPGFFACLEWVEAAGVSQILIVVPRGDTVTLKKFLFLGFSKLPEEVLDDQIPSWCCGYAILVMDLVEF